MTNPAWSPEDLAARDAKIAKRKFPPDGHPYFLPPYQKPDEWFWEPYKTVILFGLVVIVIAWAVLS